MGTETLGVVVVEVEAVLVGEEAVVVVANVVVVVANVDVVVANVDVVVAAVEPVFIANPQPCEGSFSASGSEMGIWDGTGVVVVVVGADVNVVVVVPDGPEVVLVGDDVVVEYVAALFLEDSNSNPASSRATSSTERIIRKGQRRAGWGSGELAIASTVTVEGLNVIQEIGSEQ
jgi:hypothetical protein